MSRKNTQLLRAPENRSLRLHYQSVYNDLPVQTQHGPLIQNYLDRAFQTVSRALAAHPRTFAFRVDLRFPETINLPSEYYSSNIAIMRFIESFKAKIKYSRDLAKHNNPNAHDTGVRYIWAREHHQSGVPHYHLIIFLNADAFNTLGTFELNRKNIFNRLIQAWASALKINDQNAIGLVNLSKPHFSQAPFAFIIDKNSPDYTTHMNNLFTAISYLCKYETKTIGQNVHAFQTSHH